MWKVVHQIYDKIRDKAVVSRGLQLANYACVTNLQDEVDDSGHDNLTFISATIIGDTGDYKAGIVLDQNLDVDAYDCECEYFRRNNTPCKHLVALANMYAQLKSRGGASSSGGSDSSKQKLVVTRKIDKSDIFLQYNKLCQTIQTSVLQPDISITPFLVKDYDNIFVRFKIGNDKMYIVKDIAEFVIMFDQQKEYFYGNKFIFAHQEERLLPAAKKYLQYMRSSTQEVVDEILQLRSDYRYGGYSTPRVDRFSFIGSIADIIFELCKCYGLEFKGDKQSRLFLKDTLDKIDLIVQKTKEGSYYLEINSDIFVIRGNQDYYILHNGYLSRCDEFAYKVISPIAKELSVKQNIFMTQKHLQEWVNNIAPLIEPYFNVIYQDINVAQYQPLPLVTEFYLDINENRIVGDLKCFYGDKQVNIYDEKYINSGAGLRISELKVKSALQKYFIYTGVNHIIVDEDKQYDFVTGGIADVEKVCDIFASDTFNNFGVKKKPTVNVGIKLDGELLDIDVTFDGEYTSDEIVKILQAYKSKKKYVKISASKFVDLNGADYEVLDDLAEISGKDISAVVSGSVTANKYRALHLDNIVKSGDINYTRNTSFKQLIKSVKSFEDADFEIAPQLDKKLRHYQKVGFRWFKALSYYGFGGILADDMGLGKSVQTVAFLQSLGGVSIVVCPSSLILNWKNEFEKFAPDMKIVCVYGAKGERENLISQGYNYDVIITSYEILKKDIDNYSKINFEAAILDEGQYIKNHITLNAKAVKTIKSKYRFALTGTPIENNIAELWSIFDFIMPGYLYNYHKFSATFESKIVKEKDAAATNRLKQMVAPFVLRRLKKDVLKELPPKIDNLVSVPLQDEQRALYAANLAVIKGEIEGIQDYSKGKFMVLSYLLKLRQICCSPSLIAQDYNGNSAKMDACMDLISTSVANGHKILVFSQFTSLLAIIKQNLIALGISHFLLQGDTLKENRMSMVNSFNSDNTSVFLLSLKAGGTGLNLTAADVVIHYDPWWNLSVQNQATDRAHRIGQNKSVQVYRLILKDTIEEKIVQLQEKKQELFDSIIKEGEVDFTKMSKEQLLDLLQN